MSLFFFFQHFWASVLRSKYVKSQDQIPQVQAKAITDSPLWKAICKVWHQVIAGTTWSIGNGRNEALKR